MGGPSNVASLDFLILGPLLVIRDGEPVPLGRGKPRTLLAILLLHANEAVPLGYIADRLWGDERWPARAARSRPTSRGCARHWVPAT
jgi:DNA-binding SARP family transcriptional activator